MANHEDLLGMANDEFDEKVRLLEAAFDANSAAFFYDTHASQHGVDVFDFFNAVDAEDANEAVQNWIALRDFAAGVQPFITFAFQDAPDSVVESWADLHLDDSGEEAVRRVQVIRDVMTEAAEEWESRFTDLGPSLGDVKTSFVYSAAAGQFKTVLRMDSFLATGNARAPIGSTRKHFDAVLTRRELRRLIDHLQVAESLYADAEDGDTLSEDGLDGTEIEDESGGTGAGEVKGQ